MTKEPFPYRARKWMLQQITSPSTEQLDRIRDTDWDVLLILDACRYDMFSELVPAPVEPLHSHASATPQWIRKMSDTGEFDGVTVVTGNPQYKKVDREIPDIIEVFDTDWNNELGTVLPEPIFENIESQLEEGGGPVLGHFVQPHWPYVMKVGETWTPAMDSDGIGVVGRSAQVEMSHGKFDPEFAKRAYRASLRSVWSEIEPWIGELVDNGYRVVVTADHGELFGGAQDLWMYEHPSRVHIPPLTQVPWVDFNPSEGTSVDSETESKLEALGYKQ